MEDKKLQSYVQALENLVVQNEGKSGKSQDEVVKMLITALADEWLASYQYWVCKNLSRGPGKSDADPEFDQHFKDEMEHADKLILRIKELGGKPIFNPKEWLVLGNPWTEVNTTVVKEQLGITIQAEIDAMEYYGKIIDYVKGFDEITMRLVRGILADEAEHLYDLQMLIEELE